MDKENEKALVEKNEKIQKQTEQENIIESEKPEPKEEITVEIELEDQKEIEIEEALAEIESESLMDAKKQLEIEKELKKFNWGAFGLGTYWGIGNKAYLGLLNLIPFFNFIWMFVCGFKGNEWAWKNGDFKDIEEFKKIQASWKVPGIVAFSLKCITVVFYIIMCIFFFSIGLASGLQREAGLSGYDIEYLENYVEEGDDYDEPYEDEVIGDIASWDQETFDSLKLAVEVKEEDSELVSFKEGSKFKDLVKKVGQPTYTNRDVNTITAGWESTSYGSEVVIIYDISTDQIIRKDFYTY